MRDERLLQKSFTGFRSCRLALLHAIVTKQKPRTLMNAAERRSPVRDNKTRAAHPDLGGAPAASAPATVLRRVHRRHPRRSYTSADSLSVGRQRERVVPVRGFPPRQPFATVRASFPVRCERCRNSNAGGLRPPIRYLPRQQDLGFVSPRWIGGQRL
ncbi:unnamed protein product [Urochloa humidicola]